LFDIKTKIKDDGRLWNDNIKHDRESAQGRSGKLIREKNEPFQHVDLLSGKYGSEKKADFLASQLEIMSGSRSADPDDAEGLKSKIRPDYSTGVLTAKNTKKGHDHKDRVIETKQQPIQKLSQILRCFKLVEYNVYDILVRYKRHFHNCFYPTGKLIPDPYIPGAWK